jgi:GDP-4-dehydro-6-deoxy-D-mannose reductase
LVTLHTLDLRDPAAVNALIAETQPDHIYHLAAQALVKRSFDDPWETLETNIRSQLNVFEACLRANLQPRILVVSTGELYANATHPDRPADELTQPQPTSPYSVSKLAQELLGIQYHASRQLPVIIVRPFNQLGPGQREGFVAPDFAMQIARIEAGLQPPSMHVGNLDAQRDFTDVRDVARAKMLLMASGTPGETYNIATGRAHSIQEILDFFLSQSRVPIDVRSDPARMRPANVPLLWGDATKLRHMTGWQPEISLQQSLLDVLDDCRGRVQSMS